MRSTGLIAARLIAVLSSVVVAAGALDAQPPPPMTKPPSVNEVDGRGLPAWTQDLKSPDASVREEAIRAIVQFSGPHGRDLVDLLIARSEEADSSVRVRACMALTVIDVEKGQVERIVKAMGKRLVPSSIEPQSIVRFHAAVCLLRFGDDAHPVMAEVIAGSRDPSSYEIRRLCLRILGTIGHIKEGQPDPKAIGAMLEGCKDATSGVRLEAVIGLGSLGHTTDKPLQARVEGALTGALVDKDKNVVVWALVSQMAVDKVTEKHIGMLLGYTKPTQDLRVRLQALRALGVLGDRAKSTIPALMDLLNDRDPAIVAAACGTLGYMGPEGKAALPVLKSLGEDKNVVPAVAVAAKIATAMIRGEKMVKEPGKEAPKEAPKAP